MASPGPSAAGPASRAIRHAALEILNCGIKSTKEEISEALNRIGISNFIKISKGNNEPKCRVTFVSAEDKNLALDRIARNPAVTDEAEGPWKVKSVFQRYLKVAPEKEAAIQQKKAADAVAPWREFPYPEQLKKKHDQVKEANEKWLSKLGIKDYAFHDIVASPVTQEYRNKLDFTVGLDGDGKPCAGFRVGSYREGGKSSFRVEVSDDCLLTSPKIGLKVAEFLSNFMQSSTLPVYDQDKHVGFWRAVSVRWSEKTKELMVLIRCAPEGDAEAEKTRVCNAFRDEFEFEGVKVTSLFWQWWDGISHQAPPESGFIHIFGKEYIEDEILGMRFKVSNGAFFQVNTRGAEVLFTVVRNLLQGKPHDAPPSPSSENSSTRGSLPMLLDVCCGTGVIGLLCADSASSVAGIELSAPAVLDARENAETNGLDGKARFICSKAESVLSRLLSGKAKEMLAKSDTVLTEVDERVLEEALKDAQASKEIVAIVDPPRAGLHPSVLKALLRCHAVSRIIYVSCNPTGSFVDNAMDLCGNKPIISNKRDVRETEGIVSFKPVQFIPVDMFPHTDHCELVAEFVRPRKTTDGNDADHAKRVKTDEAVNDE